MIVELWFFRRIQSFHLFSIFPKSLNLMTATTRAIGVITFPNLARLDLGKVQDRPGDVIDVVGQNVDCDIGQGFHNFPIVESG